MGKHAHPCSRHGLGLIVILHGEMTRLRFMGVRYRKRGSGAETGIVDNGKKGRCVIGSLRRLFCRSRFGARYFSVAECLRRTGKVNFPME
jgi:hypothetical protein